jgi:hypothetical protein
MAGVSRRRNTSCFCSAWGELGFELAEHGLEREGLRIGLDHARFQAGEVEQGVEHLAGGPGGAVHVGQQVGLAFVQRGAAERGDEQPQRVQRLAQVVTGRRQEDRLGAVRLFGAQGFGAQLLDELQVLETQEDGAAGDQRVVAGEHREHQQVQRDADPQPQVMGAAGNEHVGPDRQDCREEEPDGDRQAWEKIDRAAALMPAIRARAETTDGGDSRSMYTAGQAPQAAEHDQQRGHPPGVVLGTGRDPCRVAPPPQVTEGAGEAHRGAPQPDMGRPAGQQDGAAEEHRGEEAAEHGDAEALVDQRHPGGQQVGGVEAQGRGHGVWRRSPRRWASSTASIRLATLRWARMAATWTRTVFSASPGDGRSPCSSAPGRGGAGLPAGVA